MRDKALDLLMKGDVIIIGWGLFCLSLLLGLCALGMK
jgi:hypothetical protein